MKQEHGNFSTIDLNTICVAVTVEADINNINTINREQLGFISSRLYEQEAISCFTSWRKKAGWLKDIKIYALCPTGNTLSDKTLDIFKTLNVIYIDEFIPETKDFISGFWNIPCGGAWFEKNLKEDIIIKIDLDMDTLKPLPINLFNLPENGAVVGIYDRDFWEDRQMRIDMFPNIDIQTNTCLIISYRTSNVYTEWYSYLKELTIQYKEKFNDLLEEVSFDMLLLNMGKSFSNPVITVGNYQLGNSYLYEDSFSDTELKNIYFWHEPIYIDDSIQNDKKIREKIKYYKRIGEISERS